MYVYVCMYTYVCIVNYNKYPWTSIIFFLLSLLYFLFWYLVYKNMCSTKWSPKDKLGCHSSLLPVCFAFVRSDFSRPGEAKHTSLAGQPSVISYVPHLPFIWKYKCRVLCLFLFWVFWRLNWSLHQYKNSLLLSPLLYNGAEKFLIHLASITKYCYSQFSQLIILLHIQCWNRDVNSTTNNIFCDIYIHSNILYSEQSNVLSLYTNIVN